MKAETKTKVIQDNQRFAGDTGSSEVQIALLTERINELTLHLKEHKHDNHSRRGLLQLVGKRKGLLKYLEKTDLEKYRTLKKKLNLR